MSLKHKWNTMNRNDGCNPGADMSLDGDAAVSHDVSISGSSKYTPRVTRGPFRLQAKHRQGTGTSKAQFHSQSESCMRRSRPARPIFPLPSPSSAPPIIYFWKVDEEPYGPFCQWYESEFRAPFLNLPTLSDGSSVTRKQVHPPTSLSKPEIYTFNSTEQYMMAHKAQLFCPKDLTWRDRILATKCPRQQRALGRLVPNFNDEVWKQCRFEIVKWGNYYKFTANEELKKLLLDTGESLIVEASPTDKIWGVGYGAQNAPKNMEKWGLNLLGKVLMFVRKTIKGEEGGDG